MGQYYKPVNLDKKEYLYTHDFKTVYKRDDGSSYEIGEGLKLMEHSYIGNAVMNAVESLIIPTGRWYKNRLVWAGDYADQEDGYDTPDDHDINLYAIMEDEGTKLNPPFKKVDKKYHYLTNHDKKEVIDLSTIKADSEGYKIHPLSLLVCEGNGQGGGDFQGEDERVGTWARNHISLEDHLIEGFELVNGQFSE